MAGARDFNRVEGHEHSPELPKGVQGGADGQKQYPELFVQFIGWYQDENSIFLAMEYIECGSLGEYLKDSGSRPEAGAKEITRQVLEGLKVLHEKHTCYQDLKPRVWLPSQMSISSPSHEVLKRSQNILLASPSPIRIKPPDFGVSRYTIGTQLRTQCGTPAYVAPEILRLLPGRRHREREYTNAVDMWALGCLLHEILTSQTPFLGLQSDTGTIYSGVAVNSAPQIEIDMALFSQFCSGNVDLPTEVLQKSGVSASRIGFVERLLVADPHSRTSASDALSTQWVFKLLEGLDQEYDSKAIRVS